MASWLTKHKKVTPMDILRLLLQVAQIGSAVVMIILVLLHSPKGDGLGAIGGAAQVFSSQQGAESALTKITAWCAGIFFATSFVLGYYFHTF